MGEPKSDWGKELKQEMQNVREDISSLGHFVKDGFKTTNTILDALNSTALQQAELIKSNTQLIKSNSERLDKFEEAAKRQSEQQAELIKTNAQLIKSNSERLDKFEEAANRQSEIFNRVEATLKYWEKTSDRQEGLIKTNSETLKKAELTLEKVVFEQTVTKWFFGIILTLLIFTLGFLIRSNYALNSTVSELKGVLKNSKENQVPNLGKEPTANNSGSEGKSRTESWVSDFWLQVPTIIVVLVVLVISNALIYKNFRKNLDEERDRLLALITHFRNSDEGWWKEKTATSDEEKR